MKRFKTTKMLLLAAAFAIASAPAMAADKVYRLKLAETWQPNFPIFGDSTKNLAKMVETMSNGRLKISIDSANKHKAPFGIFDMVKAGQYDMGHSASYYWKGKDPNALFFTTMPFGMTAPEQYAWFYYGGGMELMEKVYDKHGVYSFPGGNTGNQTVALVVRGLALSQINQGNLRYLVRKELGVALMNGLIWGSVMGTVAWLLYRNPDLGLVMAVATLCNLVVAAAEGMMALGAHCVILGEGEERYQADCQSLVQRFPVPLGEGFQIP